MNSLNPTELAFEAVEPKPPVTPSSLKFSLTALGIAYLLNALVAMAFVLSFDQLRGVSLLVVLVVLYLLCLVILIVAAYEYLQVVLDTSSDADNSRERLGLLELLSRRCRPLSLWKLPDSAFTPEQNFAAALPPVLLTATIYSVPSFLAAIYSSYCSPLWDLGIICFGIGSLVFIARYAKRTFGDDQYRQTIGKYGQVVLLAKASRFRWLLAVASPLMAVLYGLAVILPFAKASGHPIAVAFLVLSVVPLSAMGFFVAMLLLPALAANASPTNSD